MARSGKRITIKSGTKRAISANIAAEYDSGKSLKQAVAIALSIAHKAGAPGPKHPGSGRPVAKNRYYAGAGKPGGPDRHRSTPNPKARKTYAKTLTKYYTKSGGMSRINPNRPGYGKKK